MTDTDVYDLMRDLYLENPGNMRKVMRKWCSIVRDDPDLNSSALLRCTSTTACFTRRKLLLDALQ